MNTYKIEYIEGGTVTAFEEKSSMPFNKWKFLVGMPSVRPSSGMNGGEIKTYINGEQQKINC